MSLVNMYPWHGFGMQRVANDGAQVARDSILCTEIFGIGFGGWYHKSTTWMAPKAETVEAQRSSINFKIPDRN